MLYRKIAHVAVVLLAGLLGSSRSLIAQDDPGKTYFKANCALCHADALGAGDTEVIRLGPSLVGVVGRKAASEVNYSYSNALKKSGLTWNDESLDTYLTSPSTAVPGTRMPMAVPDARLRAKLIAYLSTLKLPPDYKPAPALPPPHSRATRAIGSMMRPA